MSFEEEIPEDENDAAIGCALGCVAIVFLLVGAGLGFLIGWSI